MLLLCIFALFYQYNVLALQVKPLQCSVTGATVSLRIDLKLMHTNAKYFVQTTDRHTKVTDNFTDCRVLRADQNSKSKLRSLNCTMWSATDAHNLKQKYYDNYYDMRVVQRSSNNEIWSYKLDKLNDLMFDCFKDHRIKDVMITHNKLGPSITWRTNRWDQEYELIDHHKIRVNDRRDVDDRYRKDCTKHCSVFIGPLEPSQEEEVCVYTYFKKRLSTPSRTCKTTVPEVPPSKNKLPKQFVLIISVVLSLAAVLVFFLAGLVLFKRHKIRNHANRHVVAIDSNSPIVPRSGLIPPSSGVDFQREEIYPRAEPDYLYPSLPSINSSLINSSSINSSCDFYNKSDVCLL